MQREEGRGVDNCLESLRGVDNDLDKRRVDDVVDGLGIPACDMLAFQMLLLKVTPRWNTISGI